MGSRLSRVRALCREGGVHASFRSCVDFVLQFGVWRQLARHRDLGAV